MKKLFLSAVLLTALLLSLPAAAAQPQDFKSWLSDVQAEARQRGISEGIISQVLPDTLEPIPRVIELDRRQPEGAMTHGQYIEKIVNAQRVESGREKIKSRHTLLKKVSTIYGVDAAMIVALWGIETNYGRNVGGYDVVAALATLAYDGRRSSFFRDELFKALRILQEGHIAPEKMKGSWAGAMGQSQFMPSSFLKFAEDFDRDGKRDIWTNEADVFASAALYLSVNGWKTGQPWGRQIKLPAGFDRSLLGIDNRYPAEFWRKKGVKVKDSYEGSVIQPGGQGTQAYIVYDNYKTILSWNRSLYFATAVGLLSDRIKG